MKINNKNYSTYNILVDESEEIKTYLEILKCKKLIDELYKLCNLPSPYLKKDCLKDKNMNN